MPPSPATPTQDETYTEVGIIEPDGSSVQAEGSTVSSTQDQNVNRAVDMLRGASPLSDVSDESLAEVSKGTKRKRRSSESVK